MDKTMTRRLTSQHHQADRRRMKAYIASRIFNEEDTDVLLADGEDGELKVFVWPIWDEKEGWDLYWETDCPEAVDLRVIYEHFWRQDRAAGQKPQKASPDGGKAIDHQKCQSPSQRDEQQDSLTLTVKEAAKFLNCSGSFVYKLMSQGELAYERRGRRKLPTRESVAQYSLRNTVPVNLAPARHVDLPSTPYQFEYLFQRTKAKRKR